MYDIPVFLGKVTSLGGVEACAVVTVWSRQVTVGPRAQAR